MIGLLDFDANETGNRENQYPAISALATMGKSAVPYLVEVIKENDSDLARMNAAHALGLINRTCQENILADLDAERRKADAASEQQARLRAAENYIVGLGLPCELQVSDANQ